MRVLFYPVFCDIQKNITVFEGPQALLLVLTRIILMKTQQKLVKNYGAHAVLRAQVFRWHKAVLVNMKMSMEK